MCYHAYEMIVLHTYEYSDIYGGMVCGNVAYAMVLFLILCNVMPKDEKKKARRPYDFEHESEAAMISDKSDKSDNDSAFQGQNA